MNYLLTFLDNGGQITIEKDPNKDFYVIEGYHSKSEDGRMTTLEEVIALLKEGNEITISYVENAESVKIQVSGRTVRCFTAVTPEEVMLLYFEKRINFLLHIVNIIGKGYLTKEIKEGLEEKINKLLDDTL